MQIFKQYIKITLIVALAVATIASTYTGNSIWIASKSANGASVGQQITIDIYATVAEPAHGFSAQIRYDPDCLELTDQHAAGLFADAGGFNAPQQDKTLVDMVYTLLGAVPGVMGEGLLAEVIFKVKKDCQSVIYLEKASLLARDDKGIAHVVPGTQLKDTSVQLNNLASNIPAPVSLPTQISQAPVTDDFNNQGPNSLSIDIPDISSVLIEPQQISIPAGIPLVFLIAMVTALLIFWAAIKLQKRNNMTVLASDVHVSNPRLASSRGNYPIQRRQVMIGRETGCDLQVNHPAVSRRHAQITCERGRYYIADIGSHNGTYLNGKRIGSGCVKLGNGDKIHLGSRVVFRFVVPPNGIVYLGRVI